jgi:hypothetical protein
VGNQNQTPAHKQTSEGTREKEKDQKKQTEKRRRNQREKQRRRPKQTRGKQKETSGREVKHKAIYIFKQPHWESENGTKQNRAQNNENDALWSRSCASPSGSESAYGCTESRWVAQTNTRVMGHENETHT